MLSHKLHHSGMQQHGPRLRHPHRRFLAIAYRLAMLSYCLAAAASAAPRAALSAAATTARTSTGARGFLLNRGRMAPPVRAASTLQQRDEGSLRAVVAPEHRAFDLVNDTFVPEYGVRALSYLHKKSGAQMLSVLAPDDNKVFGITFRTPPEDSTGVPHILEHSVLCGSRKFPVKEPFAYLLKGSLQTFLNAFTYPDRTCYPVASQNLKDFYNLVHVYMDAVLHPRAMVDPQVLEQEGWHYEIDPDSGKMIYKGVVYNEMKGVYSSPDAVRERMVQRALFPNNTYNVDSGGDPMEIPSLTFEKFKEFHTKFYHPQNSKIFFYGDDDPLKRLELMDEYLHEFDAPAQPTNSSVGWQPKLDTPQRMVGKFPVAPGTPPRHTLTVNWLLNDHDLSSEEELALSILDHLLLGTSSSVLRKALIESGLGDSVTGGGLGGGLKQITFGIGLKGIQPEKTHEVEKLIEDTLAKIASEGFADEAIEASVNSMEFDLREFNTGSYPRGLSFMLGCLQKWIYDSDPVDAVRFEEPLRRLKEKIHNKEPVFQDLIRNYLLNNNHRLTLEMVPDADLENHVLASEDAKLAAIRSKMSAEELAAVSAKAAALQAAQQAEDSPEARASIPMLGLQDLDPLETTIPRSEQMFNGVKLLVHEQPTNGILYTDVAFDMKAVPVEDWKYLPIFVRLFAESGTSTMDDIALSRRIGAQTGGVGASFSPFLKLASGRISQRDDVILKFMVRGKAVIDKLDSLYDIIGDLALDAKLDNRKRVIEILKESKIRYESAFASSGNGFASTRLGAQHSMIGFMSELTGGVSYYQMLPELIAEAEHNWPAFLGRLEGIRQALISRDRMLINLTGDERTLKAARPHAEQFINNIPERPNGHDVLKEWNRSRLLPRKSEGLVVPTQVNYVVQSGQLYQPGELVSGSSAVVSRFLGRGFLWDNVRVIGGAYGGSCRFAAASGLFTYSSYRDPNLVKTLKTYEQAAEHLLTTPIPEEELHQAIIGAVGDLDVPQSPDQRGYTSMARYIIGQSDEDRLQWRQEVLSTSVKDFREFGERLKALNGDISTCVVGSKSSLEEANQQLGKARAMDLVRILGSSAGAVEEPVDA